SLLFGPLRSSLQAGATPTHVADAPSSLAVIHRIDCSARSNRCSGTSAASGTPWPISAAVASGTGVLMHFAWMGDDSRGHFARVRSQDRVRRDPRHSGSETARALEGKLRRFSDAFATSREGHPRLKKAATHRYRR